jgi:hypothetical protein
MTAFADSTLLKFTNDAFVTTLLNGVGLDAILNTTFETDDFSLQSVALGPLKPRAYKVPAFQSIRISGADERILPDAQRTISERVLSRQGRLDWVDVAFDAILKAKVQALIGPLQSVTVETLEAKLGQPTSLDDLHAKLTALFVAPSIVDAIFAELRITTLEDFERQRHLFVQLVGAPPPAFDPNDPAAARDFRVSMCVKIADGFDVGGALQSAKLCRTFLESDAAITGAAAAERPTPYTFITLFADVAVTDNSLPGMNASQAKTAVRTLFSGERMFAQFIT